MTSSTDARERPRASKGNSALIAAVVAALAAPVPLGGAAWAGSAIGTLRSLGAAGSHSAAGRQAGGQFDVEIASPAKCAAQGFAGCKRGDTLHVTTVTPGKQWRVRNTRTGVEHLFSRDASGKLQRQD